MSATIDQKEYLKRYLSGKNKSDDKKKKKRKKIKAASGVKVIDDDLDVSKMRSVDDTEIELIFEGDDAPQIAGIIDERADKLKSMDAALQGAKWRVIGQDDGFSSKLSVQELLHKPRKSKHKNHQVANSHHSDSNQSQPRNDSHNDSDEPNLRDYDSFDIAPNRQDKSRFGNKKSTDGSFKYMQPQESADLSPPRKRDKLEPDNLELHLSPQKQKTLICDNSGTSLPKHKSKDRRNSDISPPRRNDLRKSPGSDLSPPRRRGTDGKKNASPERFQDRHCTNASQGRHRRAHIDRTSPMVARRQRGSPDLSPPRKGRAGEGTANPRKSRWEAQDSRSDRNPMSSDHQSPDMLQNSKLTKTLDGKSAGLQDAKHLASETRAIKRREDELFAQMSEEVSGRNADAVIRNKGKRETSSERAAQREREERQKELDAKYAKWGKGLKQAQAQEENVHNYMHEANKPLARYKGDVDLDEMLRRQDREGDPMLEYLKSKGRGDDDQSDPSKAKPIYKGAYPPNRFNIRPGYRWDGVDRSNGYEKKYFENKNKKIAQENDAYKWSTEDM